jgi:uncharacterized protein GlcG (DUF336 family)
MNVTLAQADAIADGVLAEARRRKTKPLGVIVLDAGAHPVVFKRDDGATLFRFDIAHAKAKGALGFGSDTREIAAKSAANPTFFTTVAIATQGSLVLSPGGVLIGDAGGEIIGSVGVSGDTADIDEACALAGIAAAGLLHNGVDR